MLRGIQALAEVRALVFQRCEELRGRLLQVSDVAEGQIIGVMVQREHFFACASVPKHTQMHMTKGWVLVRVSFHFTSAAAVLLALLPEGP